MINEMTERKIIDEPSRWFLEIKNAFISVIAITVIKGMIKYRHILIFLDTLIFISDQILLSVIKFY